MNTSSALSSRERQVLSLVANEYSTKQIAATLHISDHTVSTHRKNMMIKMSVTNTAGLVRAGFERGILSLESQMPSARIDDQKAMFA